MTIGPFFPCLYEIVWFCEVIGDIKGGVCTKVHSLPSVIFGYTNESDDQCVYSDLSGTK